MFFNKKKKLPKLKKKNSDCPKFVSSKHFKPNGCGPKVEGWRKIYAALIPDLAFGACCNCHDFGYFVGGCKKFKLSARYDSDVEMLADMKETIKNVYFWRRPLLLKLADLYFAAVRNGGERSFNWFETIEEFVEHLDKIGFDRENFDGLQSAFNQEAFEFVLRGHRFARGE